MWEEVPYVRDGVLRARALVKGTEIHFEVIQGPVIFRRVTREFLAPLFERMGFLTTRTELTDEQSGRFVERLGFKHLWSDSMHKHYMMTALPFGQEK